MTTRPWKIARAALLALPAAACVAAPADGVYAYPCDGHASLLMFNLKTGRIAKSIADGDGRESVFTIPIPCDDELKFCVREGFDPLRGAEQAHVFAVPRQLRAGATYRAGEFSFRVGAFSRSPSGRLSAWIDVTPARELSGPYALRVEDRRGVVEVRFDALSALANRDREAPRPVGALTCAIEPGKEALFSRIRFMK
ncbi:hypothetical protein [Mitsuaria sp. GD03876]|uniref:hypothetical protein n=1 Tax=Mitsuaria sp. GD03876 TaxID=2975399 RepID=UPI00244A949A|nr:hypothetical protein [Mitsuaria sp. GD03876]MDH0863427.1 hypothetical protein [Mitsuaria sp. GD03876]